MSTTPDSPSHDDEMPAEIDFSKGVRGKFYRPDIRLVLPARLQPQQLQATEELPP